MNRTQNEHLKYMAFEQAYPAQEGWEMQRNARIGPCAVDLLAHHPDGQTVLALFMHGPLVHSRHLQSAVTTTVAASHLLSPSITRVVLVYGHLLIPPPLLPESVHVLSLDNMQHDHILPEDLYDVSIN